MIVEAEKIVQCRGFVLSAPECRRFLLERYEAYFTPIPSIYAVNQGTIRSRYDEICTRSWSFTRTSKEGLDKSTVLVMDGTGRLKEQDSNNDNGCLAVACYVLYNPENKYVKKVKYEERETNVRVGDYFPISFTTISSTAPIIANKFVWLNKKECESGESKLMLLYPKYAPERTVAFDKRFEHSDWGRADNLRKQCDNAILSILPKGLKDMLVTVEMTDKDYYGYSTPIFKKVFDLFDEYREFKIDSDELKRQLKEIKTETQNKANALNDINEAFALVKELGMIIAEESKMIACERYKRNEFEAQKAKCEAKERKKEEKRLKKEQRIKNMEAVLKEEEDKKLKLKNQKGLKKILENFDSQIDGMNLGE